eukprot:RCo049479
MQGRFLGPLKMIVYLWPPTSPLMGHLTIKTSAAFQVVTADNLIPAWAAGSSCTPPGQDELLVLHSSGGVTASAAAMLCYGLYSRHLPALLLMPSAAATAAADVLAGLGLSSDPIAAALLEVQTYEDSSAMLAACERFLDFPSQPGRIITVEGGDGAGKETQARLLVDRLRSEGYSVETLDFPHDRARHGDTIREVLSGKYGKISDLNPMLFSTLYAFNRHDTLPRLKYWLRRGKVVVLDRYSSANWGHQASKFESDEERHRVIDALRALEHEWLGLPAADLTLYLDLPPTFALKAMQADKTRATLDIHETAGLAYKNRVRDTFLWCCTHLPRWRCVPCVAAETEGSTAKGETERGAERRLSREEVHRDIYDAVRAVLPPLVGTSASPPK